MENKIKILPQSLSNKIAAGEVVNRPESAVKELIENSLDAGATEIKLIIKEAGKTLIQIIDNGSGMSEEDALMAFQRHSTSKINTYEDLENILSFGFRGEALASICSVSQVELKTKTAEQELGTLIKIEGNEIIENSKASCENGTSISIKNLFFNTPGRRNFLKSNQTEFKHIYETFIKLAISKPGIAFQFINNDDVLFDLKPSTLIERLENIFTKNLTNELIPVENNHSVIKVNGFISKPNFTKKAKQDQYFYLNNRIINSKNLNYAVYSGYDDLIEKGDYPSFFLFIDIIPSKVDVNVHPSKLEVKFDNEGAVFGFIRNSVKEALRKADLVFEVKFDDTLNLQNTDEALSKNNAGAGFKPSGSDFNESRFTFAKSKPGENFPEKKSGVNIHSIFDATKKFEEKNDVFTEEPLDENTKLHQRKPEEEKFNIWQYQLKYVMCQTETGLMIIDQHAAHERILYEKALLQLESQSSFSQQLLIPIKVELTKIDYRIAQELKNELQNLGFNFNSLKNDTIELIGLPSDVRLGDERKIFQELLDQYKDYELKLNLEKRDNLAKSFSCRSAIKTGDRLTIPEMTTLVDNLFACTMPYVCPHGRPTVIRITTDELDRRFSRT